MTEVACVVVESSFTSLPDLGAQLYPWLPVRLLSRLRYDNAGKQLWIRQQGTQRPALEVPGRGQSAQIRKRGVEVQQFDRLP